MTEDHDGRVTVEVPHQLVSGVVSPPSYLPKLPKNTIHAHYAWSSFRLGVMVLRILDKNGEFRVYSLQTGKCCGTLTCVHETVLASERSGRIRVSPAWFLYSAGDRFVICSSGASCVVFDFASPRTLRNNSNNNTSPQGTNTKEGTSCIAQ